MYLKWTVSVSGLAALKNQESLLKGEGGGRVMANKKLSPPLSGSKILDFDAPKPEILKSQRSKAVNLEIPKLHSQKY